MKRTFWTRNLFIGVLMGLVLAFSVPGTADALTLSRTSGDLVTVAANQPFTLRFSVGGFKSPQAVEPNTHRGSATDIEYADPDNTARVRPGDPTTITSNFTVIADTGYTAGDTHYYTVTTTSTVRNTAGTADVTKTLQTRNWVTESAAYYNNDESVSITSTPTLMKGNTAVSGDQALIERHEESDRQLSTSVTLTGRHATPGAYDIVITDDTVAADIDGTPPTSRASITFTVYVVGALNAAGTTAVTTSGDGTTDGVERVSDQQDMRIDAHFTFAPADHQPVNYSVEGSGRLYVSIPTARDRKTSPTNNLYTSSSAAVFLDTNAGSSKVTAHIAGSGVTAKVLYIFSGARLNELPQIQIQSGDGQTGAPEGRLDDYFEVRVTDGRRRAISGLPVTFVTTAPASPTTASEFIPVPGTRVYAAAPTAESIDAGKPTIIEATTTNPAAATTHHVQTDRNGVAKIYYQLSSSSETHTVTATAHGIGTTTNPLRATLTATASSTARARLANLEIVSGNNQRGERGKYLTNDLVVIVRSLAGHRVQDAIIQFRTTTGTLVAAEGTDQPTNTELNLPADSPFNPSSGQQIYVETGANGEAGVSYNVGQVVEARDVIAEVRREAQTSTQYDFAIDRVVFRVNGSSSTRPPTTREPAAPRNVIGISPATITGEPGEEITLSITSDPSVRFVTLSSADFANSLFSPQSGTTPFQSTLTLPDEDGDYDISATSAGLTSGSASVTVETGILGRISITRIGTPSGGTQSFSISVVDSDGDRISSALTVRLSGSGFTSRNIETLNGIGNARLTLPTTAGLYTLSASAENYTSGTTQVRIAATGRQETEEEEEEEEEEETPTVSEPDSLRIIGPSTRTGSVNEVLGAALIVQVLDADNEGIEEERVIFRVKNRKGKFANAKGNLTAVIGVTDENGHARARFTPTSPGSITVEAEHRDITRKVSFTITATGAGPTPGPSSDTGTPSDTERTPSTISPVVNGAVGAASRPPMLWVSGGKIYVLMGSEVKEFIAGVENAMSLAIGGSKLYWTEKTSATHGTLNSADLDGTQAKELRVLWGVPRGITVDTVSGKLYWTDAANRLQSSNLDGSGIQNVLRNLSDPQEVVLAGGNAYWIGNGEGGDTLVFINLTGQKINPTPIASTLGTYGSLTIAGGKLYWTEQISATHGRIHSANLDGTGAKALHAQPLWGAPIGIAVDTARSHLYWTDAVGRLQRANLDGSGIHNVAKGLGRPGDMLLSNSITASKATVTVTSETSTAKEKYDVNGDGTVDSKDVDAILVALAAGSTDTKYDVDGNGKVDIFDLIDLRGQVNAAASAPTLLGMKFTAVERDRLQEQIDLLIATGDRSPAALKTLIYLQQLLVMARPEKTQLLANYPNPFNPETWIPYELATDTDVRITIFNAQGVVVRVLLLGQQSAGYYTDRERAAYWDGRNALGEQVASGIYFYQLETDEMSSMRKMVILK